MSIGKWIFTLLITAWGAHALANSGFETHIDTQVHLGTASPSPVATLTPSTPSAEEVANTIEPPVNLEFLNTMRLPASFEQTIINESLLGSDGDIVIPDFTQAAPDARDIASLQGVTLEPQTLPVSYTHLTLPTKA